ncbi:MAG: AI-2E family transporter, partial [Kaistella sp.]
MPNRKHQISEVKIKQIFLLVLILVLAGLISYHLSLFIPSVLGAITLYIITRKYNLYLQEEKEWKPWAASMLIILATLVILILPVYFIADLLIEKLGNASAYMQKFNVFIDKIHDYVYSKTRVDILSKDNLNK